MYSTVPKCWADKGWLDICSDVCWEDHGGTWGKRISPKVWIFVQFGRLGDTDVQPYYASVRLVDLRKVTGKTLLDATRSCGSDDLMTRARSARELEVELAYCCESHGVAAPMSEHRGNRADRTRAEAFRSAEECVEDEEQRERLLDRPVNKIGSTARDFMHGDSMAGVNRYALSVVETGEAPDDAQNLMLKLHGVDVERLKAGDLGPRAKTVKQGDLTGECWMVQVWGTTACTNCEAKDTDDCGGQEILATHKNSHGIPVDECGLDKEMGFVYGADDNDL